MKIIWTLIALSAVVAVAAIYKSNHRSNHPADEQTMNIIADCPDSYPPVVTIIEQPATGDDRVHVNCKPDRFIKRHVPEQSL